MANGDQTQDPAVQAALDAAKAAGLPDPGPMPKGMDPAVWLQQLRQYPAKALAYQKGTAPQNPTQALAYQQLATSANAPTQNVQGGPSMRAPVGDAPLLPRGPETTQEIQANTPPKATLVGPEDQWQTVGDIAPASLASHPEIQANIDAFRGKPVGVNEKGNPVYELTDPGTGAKSRYVKMQAGSDQYHDTRVLSNGQVVNVELPTAAYMPQVNQIIAETGGRDPWTNKPFTDANGNPLSMANMTDEQKVALAARIHAWNDSRPMDDGQIQDLSHQRQAVQMYDQMQDDMSKLNDEDVTKWAQWKQDLANLGSADFIGKGSDPETVKRRAFVDLQTQMNGIQAMGKTVLGRQPGEETTTKAPNIYGATPKAVGWEAGLSAIQALIEGGLQKKENFTQLRNSLPQATNQAKKLYYDTVNGMTNQRYRTDDQMRQTANLYKGDLQGQGFGPNDNILQVAPLAEGPKSPVAPAVPGTPAAIQPQGTEVIQQPPALSPDKQKAHEKAMHFGAPLWPSWGPQQKGYQHGGLVQPSYPPLGPRPASNTTQMASPPPPPITKKAARPVPSYANQAELDAAGHEPGTVFHWQPDNTRYVKI